MLRVKRAREQIELDDLESGGQEAGGLTSLEGDLKKVRISHTPGQIRLQKDIDEAKQRYGLTVTLTDNPSSCILHFPFAEHREIRFLITVSKYYPHNHPMLRCLDFCTILPFLDNLGNVMHRGLKEDWTAICSIDTIIQILQVVCHQIRESLVYQSQRS